MTSISNMKIGKKIALVLGGIVLLLIGLSTLGLWGIRTNERLTTTAIQRLTKARLAETIAGDNSEVGKSILEMVIDKKVTDERLNHVADLRKSRSAALEQFRALADTPTSIKHGADMADLVQASSAAGDG